MLRICWLCLFLLGLGFARAQAAPLLQNGHSESLESLAFAPDGILASADETTTRIWNQNGVLLHVLRGGGPLAWSNNGRFLAVGTSMSGLSSDGVRIWNAKTWKLQIQLKSGGVAFSRDSRRFLCAWKGEGAAVLETQNWRVVRQFRFSDWGGYQRGALSSDGQFALVVNSQNYDSERKTKIEVFDVSSGKVAATLGAQRGVKSLDFSPDNEQVALGEQENTLVLWNFQTGTTRVLLNGPTPNSAIWPVYGVQFSDDGARLYATSDDKTTKVFDAKSGELLRALPELGDNYAFAMSRDETRFARRGGRSALISDAAGQLVFALPVAPPRLDNVTFSGRGEMAFSAGSEVQVWNLNPFHKKWSKPVLGEVSALQFTKNGLQVAVSKREEELESGEIWNCDLQTGKLLGVKPLAFAPTAISRDGIWMGAHRLYGNEIELGDARSGKKKPALKFSGQGMSFAFGPPDFLASASRSEEIEVWNLKTHRKELVHRNTLNNDFEARILAFSSRGKLIAGAGFWGLRVWDARKSRERQLPDIGNVTAIDFSPDETILASGEGNGTVSLWILNDDGHQKTRRIQLGAHVGAVTSFAFSGDRKTLISTGADGTFKMWDIAKRALNATVSFANGETQRGYLIERGGKTQSFLMPIPQKMK